MKQEHVGNKPPKYRRVEDLTSDVMFEIRGANMEELFVNAAEALLSEICKIDQVGQAESREVEASGADLEEWMHNWLQELILLVDVEQMFFSRFEITELDENLFKIKAKCYGEPMIPEKGETAVKAVTKYNYGLEKTEQGYRLTFTLDI